MHTNTKQQQQQQRAEAAAAAAAAAAESRSVIFVGSINSSIRSITNGSKKGGQQEPGNRHTADVQSSTQDYPVPKLN